ncbi:MAG: PAS domain S-box protein [Candidatus Brocadiae bacterium]|nr:PAS domain S-box protein [Candidatus Brocadiia bacterium]
MKPFEVEQDKNPVQASFCLEKEAGTRKGNDALLQENIRLKNIIDGTNVGTWEWNVQTGETVFNGRWAEIIGYTLEEIGDISIKTWEKFAHPDDIANSYRLLELHFAGAISWYECECRMKHKKGHWVWVHDRGKVITRTEEGKPLMMFGTHTDITEKKLSESRMIKNEKRLHTILEISNSFLGLEPHKVDFAIEKAIGKIGQLEEMDRCYVFLFDDEKKERISNTHEWCAPGIEPQKEKLQSSPSSEIAWVIESLSIKEVLHIPNVKDLPEKAASEKRIFEDQSIQSLLLVSILRENSLIGFLGFDSVVKLYTWEENAIYLIEMVANIFANALERRQKEILLQENESNYRNFIETIDEIVLIGDGEGKIIYSNPATSKKLGYSSGELKAKKILELHPPHVRDDAGKILMQMFQGKRNCCPLPLVHKNGAIVPVETRIWFGKWSGQDCIFGLSKDLSKEQESLQKFEKLFRMNPALMAISSIPDRCFVDVNDAFMKTMGYSLEEIIGKSSKDLQFFVDQDSQDRVAYLLFQYGFVRGIELQVRTKSGEIRDGLFSGDIIESQGEKYFLTVMVDITERKKAEKEREKMIQELQIAIDQIKALKGIVPICAGCKKIRDDKGYWEQVEDYIARHIHAELSHGICPECKKKLYPDFCHK